MSQFSFTITGAEVDALKGTSSNSSFEVVVDRGMQRQTQHNVLIAKFGDGYEQRALSGINTKMDNFTITLNNRTASSINLVAAYLDDKAGKNFDFTVTDLSGDKTMKVACEAYNISYGRENFHSLQAQLRRVYEP